ncbi:uncharacterized protein PHALS_12415 [Plasmopara halstedii]|uniref:Uncharacterized protein n=1 Tax=Plasmopara halstedii TaxID=4781 RepID=A0A0P1ALT2_PLAHL|nr:uncharacterized protein PHALS_12415 [Plasmopara halstedii]CEG42112.1 hypothetical protein PHALS_12415 [Plasmopara halstedii]|eukprot:XP_024578481.1 hypothetical protein PHALS_12415 [Plasmopara halstedii]
MSHKPNFAEKTKVGNHILLSPGGNPLIRIWTALSWVFSELRRIWPALSCVSTGVASVETGKATVCPINLVVPIEIDRDGLQQ